MLMVSGFFNVEMGRPNSSMMLGRINTMWHLLSMSAGLFMGKATEGPVSMQSQTKCLDFRGGGLLTELKLFSELSVRFALPTTVEDREGKAAAMKLSV